MTKIVHFSSRYLWKLTYHISFILFQWITDLTEILHFLLWCVRKMKIFTQKLTNILTLWYKITSFWFTSSHFWNMKLKSLFRSGSPAFIGLIFPPRAWFPTGNENFFRQFLAGSPTSGCCVHFEWPSAVSVYC